MAYSITENDDMEMLFPQPTPDRGGVAERGRNMNKQQFTIIRGVMLLTIIIITAIALSACGGADKAYLDHFAQINETGKSFGELNEKYHLKLVGETDEFHLYTSEDGLAFGFLSTSRIRIDNGVRGTEEVPGPPNDTDPCRCMAGSAEYMLGVTETISAQDFADSSGDRLTQALEQGHGVDVETFGSYGLVGTFTLADEAADGATYHLLLQDVPDDGSIDPDTKVHVLY